MVEEKPEDKNKEEEERKKWRLTRKMIEGKEKCFTYDKLPKSAEHEAQIPRFLEELRGMDIDLYERFGHQFMTSDGVYRIVKKISNIHYE